jgi:LacI family transcriptional regulator
MVSLGFVRNESARQLRAGHSSVVAYVVLDAGNPFFTDVSHGVEDIVSESDLSLFLCDTHQDLDRELAYLSRLEQLRVQGILVTPVDPHRPEMDRIRRRGTPVVLVDRTGSGSPHCSVAVDDVLGGRLAVEHLLDLGHTRIGFAGGPERIGQVRDRRDGAQAALAAAGRAADDLVLVTTEALTIDEGRRVGARVADIAHQVRPTAIFCANDLVALGVLQQCVEVGMTVPDDLAIVGYDDIEFAAAAAVPLTSIRQPRRNLGRAATQLLLDEATNPEHQHRQVTFTPDLVARASTRRR